MVFQVDDCGKLVELTLKSTRFSKSAVNYGASKFWSIFRNSSKNIVEIAFLFRGTVTQKRTGCFEKGGYRANKLLFWIFPLGGVGDTEKNLSYTSFFSGTPSFCYEFFTTTKYSKIKKFGFCLFTKLIVATSSNQSKLFPITDKILIGLNLKKKISQQFRQLWTQLSVFSGNFMLLAISMNERVSDVEKMAH